LLNCGIGINEILIMSGKKRHPPQKERMAQRDCHVAALLAMTEQE